MTTDKAELSASLRAAVGVRETVDVGHDALMARHLAEASRRIEAGEVPVWSQTPPSTRSEILNAARDAVLVDRAATHGAVENSFAQLAAVWSARLGQPVTPAQVALMLVDLKVTRAWSNPGHADNWVDIAGYGACGGELAGGKA